MNRETALQEPPRPATAAADGACATCTSAEVRALHSLNSKRGVACNTPLFDYMRTQ